MGEIETVEAEKMGWLDLPRGTSGIVALSPMFPVNGTQFQEPIWDFQVYSRFSKG